MGALSRPAITRYEIFFGSSPVFFKVLFSANHGLLSWTPLLAVAILGLVFFAFRFVKTGVPFVIAATSFYLFIAIFPDWAGISSYGNRFFVSLTPLFVLGLAFLMERVATYFSDQRTAVAVCSGILTCFILWNLGLIYQFGTHLIPARGPISFREATYNQFNVVPGQLTSHLRSYFFQRNDLMREIEQRDVEQIKKTPAQ